MQKNRIYITILLLFVCLTGTINSYSQNRHIKVEVSKEILVPGESFQVHYIINSSAEVKNFTVKPQPEFRFIDSFKVKSASGSFTYVQILSPVKAGKLTIPVASAVLNNQQLFSPDHTVEVLNKPIGKENVIDQSVLLPGESPARKVKDNFFLKTFVSKRECYIGENIMAEYKVFNRLNASSSVNKRPSFPGFSILEMTDTYNAAPEVEYAGETAFFSHLLRKVHLFPLQSGKFILDEAEVESEVHFKNLHQPGEPTDLKNFFEQGSSSAVGNINYQVALSSPTVEVNVKPLPQANQPLSFRGAIGHFTMEVIIKDDTNARQKNLILKIAGSGNFPLINTPDIIWPEGIRTQFKGSEEKTDYKNFPLRGEKIFTWGLSFSEKQIRIPTISFSYFNPDTAAYEELNSGEIEIENIELNKNKFSFLNQRSDIKSKNVFIRYILLGLILLAAAFFLLNHFLRRKAVKKLKAEEVLPPSSYAKAEEALKLNDTKRFYSEAWNCLQDILNEKGIKGYSVYHKTEIQQALLASGYSAEKTEVFMTAFEAIHLFRYSPEKNIYAETALLEMLKKLR